MRGKSSRVAEVVVVKGRVTWVLGRRHGAETLFVLGEMVRVIA